MQIALSIAIPTYNRANYLKDNLEVIVPQLLQYTEDIELVIGDNCSTDNTGAVVRDISLKFDYPINYIKHEKPIYFEDNFNSVVEATTGKYVYIMGDDDIVAPSFLSTILGIIKGNTDYSLIHWNRLSGDAKCHNNEIIDVNYYAPIWIGKPSDFIFKIMHKANFLSSIVFNKQCWELGVDFANKRYLGYQWFARLYKGALLHNKQCLYYYFPLVIQRNPSKTWIQYWPQYKISSLSNLFLDLNPEVTDVYKKWLESLRASIDSVLPVIINYKKYYRNREVRLALSEHLTTWEKVRMYYYLYFPLSKHFRFLKRIIKSIILKLI